MSDPMTFDPDVSEQVVMTRFETEHTAAGEPCVRITLRGQHGHVVHNIMTIAELAVWLDSLHLASRRAFAGLPDVPCVN